MIEKIRNGNRKFYRCKTCGTMFNELGDSHEHPCRPYIKINNKQSFDQSQSDGLRATFEKPFKRSYNLERTVKRSN